MTIRLKSVDDAAVKRTCLPVYEQHQATPVATFLDADIDLDTLVLYSGMVMYKSGPDEFAVCDGAAHTPAGLSALDNHSVFSDLVGSDNRSWAVWQGGPDAYFSIGDPAFDTAAANWTVPTDGTRRLLYAGTGGALGKITTATNAGGAIGELVEVISLTRIIVRIALPRPV